MTNEEAKKILMSDADFSGSGEKAKKTADALCVAIEALELVGKTEQLEPIVRCKDCKHRSTFKCPLHPANYADDFCSYGERKENNK